VSARPGEGQKMTALARYHLRFAQAMDLFSFASIAGVFFDNSTACFSCTSVPEWV